MCAFMPNLNEITKFREELKNIAHEDQITARWGERVYDELPLPDPAEVPDIDLDALLPAEAEKPADGGGNPSEAPKSEPVSEKLTEPASDMFDTVPVTDAPDVSMDTPFPTDLDNSGSDSFVSFDEDRSTGTAPVHEDVASVHTDNTGIAEYSQSDRPSTKSDEPEIVSGDAYPVDEEGMPDTSDMDTFLSSFNFDDISKNDAGASDTADSESSEQMPVEDVGSFDFDDKDVNADTDVFDGLGQLSKPDFDEGLSEENIPNDAPELSNAGELSEELHDDAASSGADDDPFNFDDMLSSFDFNPEPIKVNERAETNVG